MPCLSALILIVLVAVTGESLAEAVTAQSRKTLRVGVVLSLSGSAAMHGAAILKGAEFAADELKADGWNVTLEVQDDQTIPAKTVSAVQYLGARGHRLIIGPTWSFLIKASRPTLERMGALSIAPVGSSDINGGSSDAIMNLCQMRKNQTTLVADWLGEQRLRKVTILTPNGDWGEAHDDLFLSAAHGAGTSVVYHERFDFGIDLSSIKAMLVRAKANGIQALLTTGTDSDVANMVRARNELKLDIPLLTTDHMRDVLASGLLVPAEAKKVFVFGITMPEQFAKHYSNRYGEGPKLYTDKGYDAVRILALAVEATDGSPVQIKEFLRSVDVQGASGRIRFDERGDLRDEEFAIDAVYEAPRIVPSADK